MDSVKKRAVIAAGGEVSDDLALSLISPDCFLIAADRGLLFFAEHEIRPDLIVGDFDSVPQEQARKYLEAHPDIEVRAYSWEKDYTDLEIAAVAAADLGYREIILLGATGSRLDHMVGALQTLSLLLDRGCRGYLIDPCNRVTMHDESFTIPGETQWGTYVSFFAWGGNVSGLTLKGFHFPLENGTLTSSGTLAISNQIEETEARVCFESGRLLMVESKDRPQARSR